MFSSTIHPIGLDISDRAAKCVSVRSGFRGGSEIVAFGKCEFPEGAIVDGEMVKKEVVGEALRKMFESMPRIAHDYVVLSLPESKTFIKVIEVSSNESSMSDAIIQELPNHIPTPLEELIIDWQPNHRFEEQTMVTVGAVPKVVAEQYVGLLDQLQLKPYAFEVEAQAIVRAIMPAQHVSRKGKKNSFLPSACRSRLTSHPQENKGEVTPVEASAAKLIVDLGAGRTSFIMFDWDTIQFTSSSAISGIEATKQIAERLKLAQEEAERAKKICGLDTKKCKGVVSAVLEGMLTNLAVEIEKAIEFYGSHFHRARTVDEILLTGGGASMMGVEGFLASQLAIPVRLGSPLCHIERMSERNTFPKREALSYTTALGLALRQYFGL